MTITARALFVIFVIFQHFQIGALWGHPVSVGQVSGFVIVFLLTRGKLPLKTLVMLVVILATVGVIALVDQRELRLDGLLSNEAQIAAAALIVISASGFSFGSDFANKLESTLFMCLCCTVGYSLVQVYAASHGNYDYFAPWGEHQYLYKPILSFGAAGIPRASGLYLEPSYNAFVALALLVPLLNSERFRQMSLLLASIGILATQSVAGIISLLVVVTLVGFMSQRFGIFRVSILIAVPLLTFAYVVARLGSSYESGSSANYRILQPLSIVSETLETQPLGHVLGSIQSVVAKAGLEMQGNSASTSLDNGFYVIVFYFGWLGLGFVTCVIFWAFVSALEILQGKSKGSFYMIAPVWLSLSLLFSGAVFSVEFGLFAWLTLVPYFAKKPKSIGKNLTPSLPSTLQIDAGKR
jgi:putative colanic acid polymerase